MKQRTRLSIFCTAAVALMASIACAQDGTDTSLKVLVGKSVVVNSVETLKRVSVSDPAIATAMIVSPNQVLIHGQTPGSITLMMWDDQERSRSYDLLVDADGTNLRRMLAEAFPGEHIAVGQSGATVVLTGNVSSKAVVDQAGGLAQTQTKNVVNMLQTADSKEVVSLQVRFAEVDRAAITQWGFNIFSTGAANTIGATSTQQFGALAGNVGGVPPGVSRGRDPATSSLTSGGIGNPVTGTPAVFGLTDLLNIFLFRPDINLGAAIKALQQKNVLQILAEPNLLAMNGVESSFLAGGEFPFPVLQGGTTYNAVTIEFKEFGVRLKFRPIIQPNGMIRLKVAPEVSALDYSNALTISGFVIPAISTRRAETEVELRDGQSFAIAGLMDNRLIDVTSKIPGIGNIPILGKLFQSASKNRNNTELLVVVTPKLVAPLQPGQVPKGPQFPESFLYAPPLDCGADVSGDAAATAAQQSACNFTTIAPETKADAQMSAKPDANSPQTDPSGAPGSKKDPPAPTARTGLPFGFPKED
jgi:pilus assembly protein CpaC